MQRELRLYLTQNGITMVDPGFDYLAFIEHAWPGFEVPSVPPLPGFVPSFQKIRKRYVPGLRREDISRLATERLWKIHDDVINDEIESAQGSGTVSLLELKIELARREIQNCRLCGWLCGVNRMEHPGRCGLKEEAYYNSLFVHVAEEPVITPCAVVKLSGCALRCIFCQAHESFDSNEGKKLDSGLWEELEKNPHFEKAVSMEFVGGNPDESAYAILKAMNEAPDYFERPIVWNNNGYASGRAYKLLEGVVDVWLTDFKYGNSECGLKISGVKDYREFATDGVKHIVSQDARTVIRLLILPGHVKCCHKKILEFLSQHKDEVWVSIIDNYVPDWKAVKDPDLKRMVSKEEIEEVRELVKFYGLRDVLENSGSFWKKGQDGDKK